MVEISITKWIKKKIRRLIGIVEDTDTAVHSIASGKYVVWKGNLYKATEDIAIGDTITSGTNCAQVSGGAMGEISNLKNAINNLAIIEGIGIDYSKGYIRLLSRGVDTSSWTFYITIEYTKTTD